MFLNPLTLKKISLLRHPSEEVPLAENLSYEAALKIIEEGQFIHCHAELNQSKPVRIEMLVYIHFISRLVLLFFLIVFDVAVELECRRKIKFHDVLQLF